MKADRGGARNVDGAGRAKTTLRFAWAVLALPALTACSQLLNPLPEPIEYACTWTSEMGDTITLQSDATATMSVSGSLLLQTIELDDFEEGATFSAEARWQIGDGIGYRDYRGDPAIRLIFDVDGGFTTWTLSSDYRGGELVLLAPEEDPDEWDRIVFTSSDCFQEILDQNE